MRAGFKVSQMTQISSSTFCMSHRLHGFTQILTYSGLRAPGISESRCKDTEMVRGNSYLLMVAHTFS